MPPCFLQTNPEGITMLNDFLVDHETLCRSLRLSWWGEFWSTGIVWVVVSTSFSPFR